MSRQAKNRKAGLRLGDAAPATIFFDVGGVLLTNGWDTAARRAVTDGCGLDWEEFEDRHQLVATDFEIGRLSLDDYLERTVFYRDRDFDRDHFWRLMCAQSQELPATMEVLRELSAAGGHTLATLNNESRELNGHRIDTFGLRDHFSMFLSSCYLGHRKPEPEIFATALDITQTAPERAIFVDDRPLNLECAIRTGITAVHFVNAEQLRTTLRAHGVEI